MTDPRRAILAAVAGGSLSPLEALDRLESAGTHERTRTRTTELRLRTAHRPVRVVGDPDVRDVLVEGSHGVNRQAGTVTVSAGVEPADGFTIAPAGTGGSALPLLVRVPPGIACSIEASSTTVVVDDVLGRLALDVSAGSLEVNGAEGDMELTIRAGAATVRGLLRNTTWRINCLSASVDIELAPASGARIVTAIALGHVTLPTGDHGATSTEVGDGSGMLMVSGSVANLRVRAA